MRKSLTFGELLHTELQSRVNGGRAKLSLSPFLQKITKRSRLSPPFGIRVLLMPFGARLCKQSPPLSQPVLKSDALVHFALLVAGRETTKWHFYRWQGKRHKTMIFISSLSALRLCIWRKLQSLAITVSSNQAVVEQVGRWTSAGTNTQGLTLVAGSTQKRCLVCNRNKQMPLNLLWC